ncbi:conserved Plasmodium protein, unknown function [Plasmodium vivax]|nr:conserved Plasmodium protein, unknown function [Plasmodium vivax]
MFRNPLRKKCEITRSDCEEFIRVVKRFGKSFAEKDLAQYCRLNDIPISAHTIECMFEEFFLNKKNDRESREITADDLISLTSKKTNRCFYVPVVVYIGERDHIRSYEEGLINAQEKKKKKEQIERDHLKRQIQRDNKNRQRNEQMNYVWEDEIRGRSNCCSEAVSVDREGQLGLGSTDVKTRDGGGGGGYPVGEANGGEAPNGKTLNGETPNGAAPSGEAPNEEASTGEPPNAEQPHPQVDSPKRVEAAEKKRGNHSTHNTNNSGKMKKPAPGRKGKGAAAHQEKKTSGRPPAEEAKQPPPQEQKTDKQIYYDSLMQRVLNTIEKKKEKKKKTLTTFNFVTYYKLHELIYTSFLVDKYQGYYQGKEERDLIDIYAEEGKQMDRSEDSRGDAPGETTPNGGEAELAEKIQSNVEDTKRISLTEVIHKYQGDREKEEKKKKKFKRKTHKYIHSNHLGNYQFVWKNIKGIMDCVLHNLNVFFNEKVLDVERVMEEYSTVVSNVCEAVENRQGDVCAEGVMPIGGDNTPSGELTAGHEKAPLPLSEGEAATVISDEAVTSAETVISAEAVVGAPACASLPRLKSKKKGVPKGEVVTPDQPSGAVGKVRKEATKGGANHMCAEGDGGGEEGQDGEASEAEARNANIKRGRTGGRAKRRHPFKRPPGTHHSETDEAVDAPSDVQLDNQETASDHSISYANLKYTKEEIKQKNLIYYLTHDINKIETFKRKYFYDFFFMYMVRKLFWNVLCLYYLLWKERHEEDAPKQSGSPGEDSLHQSLINPLNSQGLDGANLILYESDVSVNNAKKNKAMLYNTNQKLCHNLDPLFKLIRNKKLLIYLRYDQNKRVKCKNKTEYLYREVWQYLILTNLRKKAQFGEHGPFSEFVLFRQD